MNILDVIAAKRDGRELTSEEIGFFVRGVVDGTVADYQTSAWLMAIFLRGMTPAETLALTLAMRDSGQRIDLTDLSDFLSGPTLDKHSTGGVGDKTTLVVVPILAACGVPMLKMSGRGLGFSGGTVDKLESIPGLRTDLSLADAKAQVRKVGAALIAQSAELAPADKIFYALRDVTATIESIPLIASSILSKKLAAGAARILLDVKVGRGAFMPTLERAEELARTLVEIGEGAGVPTEAVLTAMDEPLGTMIGNALEVREAIDTLLNTGRTDANFRALCIELAAHGLTVTGRADTREEAIAQVEEALLMGRAAEKWAAIVEAQGGPGRCNAILAALPIAPIQATVPAPEAGVVTALDARALGRLANALGAGRQTKNDAIDPAVGIELHCKTGATVTPGQPLATLHLCAQDKDRAAEFATALAQAYRIGTTASTSLPASLILQTIRATA